MKKYIAPIIITAIMVLYLLGFCLLIVPIPGMPVIAKLLFAVIPMAICGCAIAVCAMRIREIKGGEEDASRKY